MGINNFKNVNLPLLQGIIFNIFSLTLTITEDIYRCSDLPSTFRKSNIRGKSIFRAFRNNILNSRVRNDIWITGNNMPCKGIWINKILTISGVGNIGIYFYIRSNIIKVEYSIPNRCVILIANDRKVCIIKVIRNRGNRKLIFEDNM